MGFHLYDNTWYVSLDLSNACIMLQIERDGHAEHLKTGLGVFRPHFVRVSSAFRSRFLPFVRVSSVFSG